MTIPVIFSCLEVPGGRGVNCSVSDTINTLGGGQVKFEKLIINMDNCGGVT